MATNDDLASKLSEVIDYTKIDSLFSEYGITDFPSRIEHIRRALTLSACQHHEEITIPQRFHEHDPEISEIPPEPDWQYLGRCVGHLVRLNIIFKVLDPEYRGKIEDLNELLDDFPEAQTLYLPENRKSAA